MNSQSNKSHLQLFVLESKTERKQTLFSRNLTFALRNGFQLSKDHLVHKDGRTLSLRNLLGEYFFTKQG
jgi:hypothetical protein